MIDWESRLIKAKQMLDMGIMKQDEFEALRDKAFADLGLHTQEENNSYNPLGGLTTKPDAIETPASAPESKKQNDQIGQYVLRKQIGNSCIPRKPRLSPSNDPFDTSTQQQMGSTRSTTPCDAELGPQPQLNLNINAAATPRETISAARQ